MAYSCRPGVAMRKTERDTTAPSCLRDCGVSSPTTASRGLALRCAHTKHSQKAGRLRMDLPFHNRLAYNRGGPALFSWTIVLENGPNNLGFVLALTIVSRTTEEGPPSHCLHYHVSLLSSISFLLLPARGCHVSLLSSPRSLFTRLCPLAMTPACRPGPLPSVVVAVPCNTQAVLCAAVYTAPTPQVGG